MELQKIKFRYFLKHKATGKIIAFDPQIHEIENANGFWILVYSCTGIPPTIQFQYQLVNRSRYLDHEIKGVQVCEGDIIRETIENDKGDEIFYAVVTWVKEWSMFAGLLTDEYHSYLQKGVDGLDASMSWTFPIAEEKYGKREICGNIFQTPHFL